MLRQCRLTRRWVWYSAFLFAGVPEAGLTLFAAALGAE